MERIISEENKSTLTFIRSLLGIHLEIIHFLFDVYLFVNIVMIMRTLSSSIFIFLHFLSQSILSSCIK
jgi:hypothetical protein